MEWNWLKTQWGTAAGDAWSKLFKAEMGAHDLFAREVIQNSWDANDRLNSRLSRQGERQRVDFQVSFEFKQISGDLQKSIYEVLGIHKLQQKCNEIGNQKLGFEKSRTILDEQNFNLPLSALYVHDYGATGLQGDPVGQDAEESDFFRAFGELGGNDRGTGGGSYGFGKSAFIRASKYK